MKYLNLLIILIVSSVILSGCTFQSQIDLNRKSIMAFEDQMDSYEQKIDSYETRITNLEIKVEIQKDQISDQESQIAELKSLKNIKDLQEIKKFVDGQQLISRLHENSLTDLEARVTEIETFSERFKTGLVMIAGEIDKHAEAIEGLMHNDDNIKTILEIAKDIIDAINERQKIFEDWLHEIRDKLDLEE